MAEQSAFKRYELKYLLTQAQKQSLLAGMAPHMEPDRHGKTTVRNLYYDTDTYLLIRRSIEKPTYKEKLRIRSYGVPENEDTKVFFELKKKLSGVVFKRRAVLTQAEIKAFLKDRTRPRDCSYKNGIVLDEIEMFLSRHPDAYPKIFIGYDRLAFFAKDDPEVRITFDRNILTRRENVDLTSGHYGTPLLEPGKVLVEIKISETMPRWMVKLFSEAKIYRTSYSKYGTEYERKVYHERNPE